jgi:predicted membrane protein
MSIIGYFVLTVYTLALVYITVYCVMQFSLLYHYKKKGKEAADKAPEKLPKKAHRKVNQMATGLR